MTAPHIDLDRLEEVAKAATPGEWELYYNDEGSTCYANVYAKGKAGVIFGQKTNRKNGTAAQRKADLTYAAEANPAVVLELVARLRRAEAVAAAITDEDVRMLHAVAGHMRRNESPRCSGDLTRLALKLSEVRSRAASSAPMPNDPLDDVLPLKKEQRRAALQQAEGMWKDRGAQVGDYGLAPAPANSEIDDVLPTVTMPPVYAGPDRWHAQPKILPDNLPKSLDLDDTEGGSHD